MAMIIPLYGNAQVQEDALPAARQSSVVSPQLLSATADKQIRQGEQLGTAAEDLNAIAVKMGHEEDLRSVQTATAQYQEAVQNFSLDARDKRTGAAASGLVADFDQFHTDTVTKLADTLQNDAQRRAFAVMAARSRLSARHDLGTFQLSEGHKASDAAFDAVAANTINAGAIAGTDAAATAQRDILIANARAYAATRNMDADTEKAFLTDRLTAFHAQRIQNLVKDDPAAAQAYFEKNQGEIAGAQQAEIGGFAKKATATAAGSMAAESAWSTLGPQNSTEPVKIFDMEERIRSELKGNDAAIEAGIRSLRERDTAFKNQRVEASHALEASVNRLVLNGASSQQLRSSAEFIKLSDQNPAAARSIEQFVENKAYTAVSRAAASEQRADAAEARAERQKQRAGMGAFLQYSNPDVLSKMSNDQVLNLLPTLGNELTKHLMEKKQSLVRGDAKVIEARIDQQDFDHVAQEVGLRPFEPGKNEDERARLGELKYAVETRINAEQVAQKRQLTREEKMKLTRQVADDQVMVGTFFPDKRPVATLTSKEMETAYVRSATSGQWVKLAEIPASFRLEAMTARQAHGLPTTESQIAELWLRHKTPLTTVTDRKNQQIKELSRYADETLTNDPRTAAIIKGAGKVEQAYREWRDGPKH
jgi:hypothetical protein